jgi:CRISPR-associated protein Cmr2
MTYDFHARFALLSKTPITQAFAADFLTGNANDPPEQWPELAEIEDPGTRLSVLAQAMASPHKDRARTGDSRYKLGGHAGWIESGKAGRFLREKRMPFLQSLGLLPALPDLSLFPAGAWGMRFTFQLISPYISRDDDPWHLLDNPVKKERVFGLPYVAPTQWKGALRSALWRMEYLEENQAIVRMFGNPRESEEGRSGRLHFFPSFFGEMGMEVINPHDREKGGGTQPIHFECVPAGATADFVLLYVPFGPFGQDEKEMRREIGEDLRILAEGLKEMFGVFGFGAKTSSGFGLAEMAGRGDFSLNFPDRPETPEETPMPVEPVEPESVRRFVAEYPGEDFSLKPKEWQNQRNASSRQRNRFKEIKAEWLKYHEKLGRYRAELEEREARKTAPALPAKIARTFESFGEFAEIVGGIPTSTGASGMPSIAPWPSPIFSRRPSKKMKTPSPSAGPGRTSGRSGTGS